jgi:uncharacterized membrane protein YphA (DoxX/SURF4 family)
MTEAPPADGPHGRTGLSRLPLEWISTVVRLGLAAVWVFSGSAKITNLNNAITAVRGFKILPQSIDSYVGYGLPLLELTLAVLLILGLGTRFVALLSGVLLLVFIGGIISVWARGLTIDCGCFGGGGQVSAGQTQYPQEIARDVGFLLLAGWLFMFPRTRFSLDRVVLGAD